jgi:uncharacterized protein YraI
MALKGAKSVKQYKISVLLIVCIGILSLYISAAQDSTTCATIVQAALQTVDELCSATSRNQACYGNLTLEAEPQPDVTNLKFDAPGDIADVTDISALRLSALDETSQEWGVSLLRLQANLPDTLPGQNVTMLLFGNVEITPDTSASDAAPLQAFFLKTGTGDAPCEAAPDSGVLVQTPAGAATIQLRVNKVNITLGSTAYLQAQADETLVIIVVEGEAAVTAFEETQTVPAGAKVEVPLDEDLVASGPPSEPEPYAEADVQALPVSLLARDIEIAAPLIEEKPQVAESCTVTAANTVNLRAGPGTNYGRVGSLATGESARPDGQATGTDGFLWWRLPDEAWVRYDIVEASGDCESMQIVSELPPVPTAAPVSSGFTTIFFTPNCSPSTFKAGTITFAFGKGDPTWATCEDVFANISQYGFASFSGDGSAPYNYRYQQGCHGGSPEGTNTFADVELSAGVYTYTGEWTGHSITCSITVLP